MAPSRKTPSRSQDFADRRTTAVRRSSRNISQGSRSEQPWIPSGVAVDNSDHMNYVHSDSTLVDGHYYCPPLSVMQDSFAPIAYPQTSNHGVPSHFAGDFDATTSGGGYMGILHMNQGMHIAARDDSHYMANGAAYDVPAAVDMAYTTSSGGYTFSGDSSLGQDGPNSFEVGGYFQDAFDGYAGSDKSWSPVSEECMDPSLPVYSPVAMFPMHDLRDGCQLPGEWPVDQAIGPAAVHVGQEFSCASNDMAYQAMPNLSPENGMFEYPTQYPVAHSQGPYRMDAVTFENFLQRRSISESEGNTARSHEFYSRRPKKDGLYHCPYANEGQCDHKPEKLKCNYDKHLDSHLKPYHCKTCSGVRFSSTACLLRHEREAHGMHGHGDRPYSCHFQNCERAVPGKGFPRRWNLRDHMKRVHDFVLPVVDDNSDPSSPEVSSDQDYSVPARRRKSPGGSKDAKRTKTTKSQKRSSIKQWHEEHHKLSEDLRNLDPNDITSQKKLQARIITLQNLGEELQSGVRPR